MKRAIARMLATLTGAAFGLVPRRHRFAVARKLALAAAPLLRASRHYQRRGSPLDGYREEAVRLALHAMRRLRITFDPSLRMRGAALPDGPAIIASGHFLLNFVMLRWIFDQGGAPAMIANQPDPLVCYAGTTTRIDTLQAARGVLLTARQRLAAGRKVMVMIDDHNPAPGYVQVETAAGFRYVSPVIHRFAERLNVPLYFANVYVDSHGELAAELRALPREADAAFEASCRYLTEDAARIER
ncbi:MAG TPA: hypothetical protein VE010_23205 [Thermoanaerobaculia bacterium]|nr:hypothetical protein [Thermoanaerobaculia bacterium]